MTVRPMGIVPRARATDPAPPRPAQPSIGRQRESAQLATVLQQAIDGAGRCAVITGEAGIGKTRLLEDLAARARGLGVLVAWGRCWDGGGAPPFWPWTQILRTATAAAPTAAAALGAARAMLDVSGSDAAAGAERTRFLLFDAVASFLRAVSRTQPILLLFDDMHAGDTDSIALLRFVARDSGEHRLCLCVAARPASGQAARLDDLGHDALRLPVHGLSAADTEALALRTIDELAIERAAVPRHLLDALHHATGGNPFFVRETVRELVRTGTPFDAPRGLPIAAQVREVIRAQLAPLDAEARRALQVAAVAGQDSDLRVVSAVLHDARPGAASFAWLEAAQRRGLVAPTLDDSTRIRFAHALIRDAVYDDCPAPQRATWHARIADVLERRFADALPAHSAAIAHHRRCAGAAGDPVQALRAAMRAARHSESMLAYADAVAHWRRALEIAADTAAASRATPLHGELLLGLGGALNLAGDRGAARAVLVRAIDAARDAGDAAAFARAVLAYGGETIGTMEVARVSAGPGAVFDDQLAALLQEARERLGDGERALQARLLSRLAVERYFTAPMAERVDLTQRALAVARQVGEPITLGHVLCETLVAVWGPESGEARLQWSREAVRLGQQHAHVTLESAGRVFVVNTLVELGDTHALRAEAAALHRLAERVPLPLLRWQVLIYRGMRALLDARHAEAEAVINQAVQIGRNDNAVLACTVQMLELRRQQGRLAELADSIGLFKAVADQYPTMRYIRAALAHLLVEVGDRDEARRQFDIATADDCAHLARDITWLPALTRLADVCLALDDHRIAARLYALLTPWAHLNSLGTYGSVCWGSVARELGALAAHLSRWDDSARWFQMATRHNQALEARALLAQTQVDHAAMLCRRLAAGDAAPAAACEAGALLDAAAQTAQACGLAPLAERAAHLAAQLPRPAAAAPTAAASPPAAPSEPVFRQEGEYWSIGDARATVRLRDHRGLRVLALLVRHPGREIHALELLRLARGQAPDDAADGAGAADLSMRRDADDLGAMIDPQAKAAYGQRVAELRADLDDARAARDGARSAALQEELDAIARELSRAIGLGGRVRRLGSGAERARVNVTRAVGAALRRITAAHPALGRELQDAVRTGTFCSYRGPHGHRRTAF